MRTITRRFMAVTLVLCVILCASVVVAPVGADARTVEIMDTWSYSTDMQLGSTQKMDTLLEKGKWSVSNKNLKIIKNKRGKHKTCTVKAVKRGYCTITCKGKNHIYKAYVYVTKVKETSTTITKANYKRITYDMTIADVENLLGELGEIECQHFDEDISVFIAKYKYKNPFNNKYIYIEYRRDSNGYLVVYSKDYY